MSNPRWSDLARRIQDEYGGEVVAAGEVRLVVEYSGQDLTQEVRLELEQAFGQPWLVVRAGVCAERDYATRDALDHNGRLAIGALCLRDGWFVLRWTAPLAELTEAGTDRAIDALAHEAVRLRTLAAPAAAVADAFAMYTG